jgi:tagatose 1,6-diphosphate aldolase
MAFKLESPVNAADADGSSSVQAVFDEMGRLAGRPWVMLSAGAGKAEFANVLKHAFAAGASGFLAGRAIWLDAFSAYPDWNRIKTELEGGAVDYMAKISTLADEAATNWLTHSCYGEDGAKFTPANESFRQDYAGI